MMDFKALFYILFRMGYFYSLIVKKKIYKLNNMKREEGYIQISIAHITSR